MLINFILVGCATDNVQLTAEEIGYEVAGLLIREQFPELYDEWFSDTLQERLSLDEVRQSWEDSIEGNGAFLEIEWVKKARDGRTFTTIEIMLSYVLGNIEIRLVLDEQRQITGFNISELGQGLVLPETLSEEEIVIGSGGQFELNGTLTLPRDHEGKLPAVVLVQGSGPQDRDTTIHENRPFRDLAWGLAELGIAVVRYDKRTYAHHIQDLTNFTVYEETIADAILAGRLLKEDLRIDEDNVFLIGHSLGGMLAPRIQYQGGDFAGLVSLAGSPRSLWEISFDQNIQMLKRQNLADDVFYEQKAAIEAEFEIFQKLYQLTSEEARQQDIMGISAYYWQDLERYPVASLVSEMEVPMLILHGEADFQVFDYDFMLWKEVLAEHERATFISYPNLNHLFMYSREPNRGTTAEYRNPGHVDSTVIKDIGRWVFEHLN